MGRDQELALLVERWQQVKASEGQVILLTGEAGIGKSRITEALVTAVSEESPVLLRYQCSPYHGDSALFPVIQQITQAAGLADRGGHLLRRGEDEDRVFDPELVAEFGMHI